MTPHAAVANPEAIDPLGPIDDGRYSDDMVTVSAGDAMQPREGLPVTHTKHFDVWTDDGLFLCHRLTDDQIDDSLTTLLENELFGPGRVVGGQVFERLFTGIVRTSRPEAIDAWSLFYRNSRKRLAPVIASGPPTGEGLDSLEEFGAIYARADEYVPVTGTVLEVGSCFGFLALHLARLPGRYVTASDISAGSMGLLDAVGRHLHVPIRTMVCDAARIPRPDRSESTVVLSHLLEHLDPAHGLRALDEAMRVARSRVIVAVPYEDVANTAFGHVRTIDRSDLEAWGRRATGWDWIVEDHHGGWLILDRSSLDRSSLDC
ncbi:MAG: mycofactocin oligosaccharide methyltransferase MftM [Aeromicrobium sp.]